MRRSGARARASVVGYWTEVHDDIFNVLDEATPTLGYFTNLERTRRVGMEVGAGATPIAAVPGLEVSGTLAWTRATFESHAELASPLVEDDPPPPGTPPDGAVEVEPGDLFPMVPQLSGSLAVRYETPTTTLELEGAWTGRRFMVGDEGNEEEFGHLASSTILDARVERRFGVARAFVEISNLMDTDYSVFGILAENGRAATPEAERFLTPGLPRRLTAGIAVRLERR
jgi:hypothetical protein